MTDATDDLEEQNMFEWHEEDCECDECLEQKRKEKLN